MKDYEIDGLTITDLSSFIQLISEQLIFPITEGHTWQGNLDAFNDYLSWPETRYRVIFKNHQMISQALSEDHYQQIREIFKDNSSFVEFIEA